jgi:hypothetical protein
LGNCLPSGLSASATGCSVQVDENFLPLEAAEREKSSFTRDFSSSAA